MPAAFSELAALMLVIEALPTSIILGRVSGEFAANQQTPSLLLFWSPPACRPATLPAHHRASFGSTGLHHDTVKGMWLVDAAAEKQAG